MQRFAQSFISVVFLLAGILPLAFAVSGADFHTFRYPVVALNLAAWTFALALFLARRDLRKTVDRLARQFGIESRFKSFETVAYSLLREMERKNTAFLTNFIEKKITSREELSRTLERIVARTYRLLNAESAELALFDKESGLYHSSFVLGQPFRKSAQAMLSGAVEEGEEESEAPPDVLVQPVAFGGTILGSLRVGLSRGTIPSTGDREIMHLLAIQGGLAIINAQYHEELVRMKRASEESTKVKTGFLANLSHEIRGPLGIMINAVELVLDGLCGPVSEDQLDTLKMVRGNGEHLLELINDVLDYAKVESGKIVPDKTEIIANELLKDISGVVRAQAEAKKHTLSFKSGEEALTFLCDRRHIRQMLINMLTNAIKYTPEGGTIELWVERIPGGKVKINVRDSGVGIEESDRYKVFSPFERIENSYSITQMGTGLGMPLTKRLAEMNGGLIDFSSVGGKGSHFWIIFKAVEYTPIAHEEKEEKAIAVKGNGELILLVESNPEERNVLARYLSHLGFRVTATSSKVEALHILRQENVQLTVLDNNTIDAAAESLPKEIRDNARSPRIPIILLSSRAFVFDIEKYLKAGIDRCLSKPLSLAELGRICRNLLDGDSEKAAQKSTPKPHGAVSRALRTQDILH